MEKYSTRWHGISAANQICEGRQSIDFRCGDSILRIIILADNLIRVHFFPRCYFTLGCS